MSTLTKIQTEATPVAPVLEIIRLHGEIFLAAQTCLDKAIRIGELLTEQKARLKHGEWLPWLKSNIPFAERTARNYMRCHAERDKLKSASVADLTGAYRLLAEPDRPNDLLRELPNAEKLAGDISEAGQKRLESYHAQTLEQLERGEERLRATGSSLAEVLEIKRDADRLLRFWSEVKIRCERSAGLCLNEIEQTKTEAKQAPGFTPQPGQWMTGSTTSRGCHCTVDIRPSVHDGFFFVNLISSDHPDGPATLDGTKKAVRAAEVAWFVEHLTGKPAEQLEWDIVGELELAERWKYNEHLFVSHQDYMDKVLLGKRREAE